VAGAKLGDHPRRRLAGAEAPLGLPAQLGPGVGAGAGSGRGLAHPAQVGRKGALAAGGQTAGAAPERAQARRQVAAGAADQEGRRAVCGTEPDRYTMGQVQPGAAALARAGADQAGRELSERRPLVEAGGHRLDGGAPGRHGGTISVRKLPQL
jgi:hypothetical protein